MVPGQGFAQRYDKLGSIFLSQGILLFQILNMAMLIYRWNVCVPIAR
jgi:hypothetical protein